MSTYEIEKGVPIPAGRTKYPFAGMKVGDSFVVKDEHGCSIDTLMVRMRGACAWAHGKHPDRKFIVRREGGAIRVWRKA